MKYSITQENIELKYLLYKIIFPNDVSLKVVFVDLRDFVGNLPKQVGLMVRSKEKEYKPWYGVLLRFLVKGYGTPQAPGHIFGLDAIEKFLLEMKEKKYNVDDVLEEVMLAKQKKITFFGK